MAEYQPARDNHVLPIYEFTCDFAKLEPPPPEMQQLIGAMHGNQEAKDGFVSVMAGTLPGARVLRARERRPDNGRGGRPARGGTAPGVAYGSHVAVVGAAASAEHVEWGSRSLSAA